MEYQLITPGTTTDAQCQVIGVFSDQLEQCEFFDLLSANGFKGDLNKSLFIPNSTDHQQNSTLIIGCGKQDEFDKQAFLKVIKHAFDKLKETTVMSCGWQLCHLPIQHTDTAWCLQQTVLRCADKQYRFDQFKSKTDDTNQLEQLFITVDSITDAHQAVIDQAHAASSGMNLYKDLANTPANVCTPTYLANTAKDLAKTYHPFKLTVLEEADMEKLGMGSMLSVSQGSLEPAKLITLEYLGAKDKSEKPYVFIGKGVTFDSGGISLKPPAGMDEMKYDMCGAATVLGLMKAVAHMQLPLNIIGIVAASENLPGHKATKPGDIVTSMSGQTIEILNTDAEGRLLLCDALTYAEKFKPQAVVDIATLTGAMIVALGHHITGVMGNNDELADQLITAGEKSHDRIWQLPLGEEYDCTLQSNFADMANIGNDRSAMSIVAGCFLGRFAKQFAWAHLDNAGTAWVSGKNKGATGRPIPALLQFLIDRSQ